MSEVHQMSDGVVLQDGRPSRYAGVPAGPRPRLGLGIGVHTTAAGPVELAAAPDHRVRVHIGAPVRGLCGSRPFRYTRGDIDILPAGLSDAWEEERPSTFLMLRIPPALLSRATADLGLDPDRAGLAPRCQLRDPQIAHIAWALDAERRAGGLNGPLYAESLGLALATHLLGRYAAPHRPRRGLSPAQLQRVTTYIDAHLDEDLSLVRLAEVAAVSASHLKTLFKRSTGLPVHAYVVERRVERAKALLMRGELPASQVALEAGFAHQSHMARSMRRVLGVTPSSIARATTVR